MDKSDHSQNIVAVITEYITKETKKKLNKTWLSLCLVLSLALIISIIGNVFMAYQLANKEKEYFATNGGYLFRIYPTKYPVYSESDIQDFASKVISKSLQLNFVHLDSQLSDVKSNYTQDGYDSFYVALDKSGFLKEIREQKLSIKALFSPGNLVTKGEIKTGKYKGSYAWQYKFPAEIQKFSGNGTRRSISYDAFVQIIRISTKDNPSGIAVNQVILTPAN
ncbi:DotI/IcmL family type IV secretion protein [Proteus mirabilis]|uniref:DotI/IcmL family type IV secretion protein n=1 Tax=Proteus mirabilis TaxID=584 RepID=UPI001A28ECEC|nr:DotI/IcmL family type IV secretion protein [Proteus mirabilis]HEM8286027.1 DotI/IcmL family type IV secretion protein [Providencia stuartii]EKU3803943.1 DotI/IcmL family type IV secretion protein [Proteus mirabilis]EKV7963186.1 DotI/IcmL family type IV secretion protein [Proteus mirabilis]ELB1171915.1 DotI/IcmL family type IV secretion protein [Proteus mirabilis]ELB2631274.1 DotI/IcmL family type IV secretion protein [Proteus mirabilis]